MPRIAVVDDSKDIRDTVRLVLEFDGPEGLEIVEARDAEEALGMGLGRGDVAIIDGRLPGMSGLALIKLLKERGDDAPALIMCSASINEEEQQAAIDAGAMAFITKPFDIHHLVEVVSEALASQ